MNTPLYFSPPGVASAAGMNAEELWRSVINGDNSGIRQVQTCTGDTFYAARIRDELLPRTGARYDMRVIRIQAAALDQILPSIKQAVARYGSARVGVCVGSCDNGNEFSVRGHRRYFADGAFPADYQLEMQGADYVASFVQEAYGVAGPAMAFATACSSSATAIIQAAQLIRCGAADAVVVGGVDVASDTVLLGFQALGAVSPRPTNPFSRNRSGITLGDGAAFFVLAREPLDAATPRVTLAGYGQSADAHHITSPAEDGAGAESAMRTALRRAGIPPDAVGYVSLHGTGTLMNDAMEAGAVSRVLGGGVPCSATKSVTGHTLGAAGAMAAAVCYGVLARTAGCVTAPLPAQAWDGEYDEAIPRVNIVRARASVAGNIRYCMANSFAFGGANVTLILGREE